MAERVRSIVAFVKLSALDTNDCSIRLWIKSTALGAVRLFFHLSAIEHFIEK